MSEIYKIINDVNERLLSSDCDIIECLKKARYVTKYFNDMEDTLKIEMIGKNILSQI